VHFFGLFLSTLLKMHFPKNKIVSKGFHIHRHVTPYFSQFLLEPISHPITRRFCPTILHGRVRAQL